MSVGAQGCGGVTTRQESQAWGYPCGIGAVQPWGEMQGGTGWPLSSYPCRQFPSCPPLPGNGSWWPWSAESPWHEGCPVLQAREHSQAMSTALCPQQSSEAGDQRGAGSPVEDSCSASSRDQATIQGQFRAGYSKDSRRVLRFRGGFGEAWELRKRILSLLKLFFFFRMRREKSHQITNF